MNFMYAFVYAGILLLFRFSEAIYSLLSNQGNEFSIEDNTKNEKCSGYYRYESSSLLNNNLQTTGSPIGLRLYAAGDCPLSMVHTSISG
jgi:hypothetical protein